MTILKKAFILPTVVALLTLTACVPNAESDNDNLPGETLTLEEKIDLTSLPSVILSGEPQGLSTGWTLQPVTIDPEQNPTLQADDLPNALLYLNDAGSCFIRAGFVVDVVPVLSEDKELTAYPEEYLTYKKLYESHEGMDNTVSPIEEVTIKTNQDSNLQLAQMAYTKQNLVPSNPEDVDSELEVAGETNGITAIRAFQSIVPNPYFDPESPFLEENSPVDYSQGQPYLDVTYECLNSEIDLDLWEEFLTNVQVEFSVSTEQ